MNDVGKSIAILALEMVTFLSSIGCLITSSTVLLNSGSSSRNNTPLCAREISPGCGDEPPPTSATSLIVWCGLLKGLIVIKLLCSGSLPATLWIFVLSSDSSRESGGRIDGSLLASMVFPAPGGPMRITLCPPAAAISNAA